MHWTTESYMATTELYGLFVSLALLSKGEINNMITEENTGTSIRGRESEKIKGDKQKKLERC